MGTEIDIGLPIPNAAKRGARKRGTVDSLERRRKNDSFEGAVGKRQFMDLAEIGIRLKFEEIE
jgi:hypothetical protein